MLTVSQRPSWRKPQQLALLRELGERRLLVVAALGQPLERLVVEHVDAGVDPVRQSRRLAEAGDEVVVVEIDDAELRRQRRDDDRRRAAVLARARRAARRGRRRAARRRSARTRGPAPRAAAAAKRSPPPRPSGSGSSTATISAPRPESSRSNSLALPRSAADDHARRRPPGRAGATWYSASGCPATGTSAFGRPPRSVAQPLALPPARMIASTSC